MNERKIQPFTKNAFFGKRQRLRRYCGIVIHYVPTFLLLFGTEPTGAGSQAEDFSSGSVTNILYYNESNYVHHRITNLHTINILPTQ
jgi:hypothetical protein